MSSDSIGPCGTNGCRSTTEKTWTTYSVSRQTGCGLTITTARTWPWADLHQNSGWPWPLGFYFRTPWKTGDYRPAARAFGLYIDMQGGREASCRDDRRSILWVPQGRHELVETSGWCRAARCVGIHGRFHGAHRLHIYSTSRSALLDDETHFYSTACCQVSTRRLGGTTTFPKTISPRISVPKDIFSETSSMQSSQKRCPSP